MTVIDPRSVVEAPVRQALLRLVAVGVVVFALACFAGLCGPLSAMDPAWHARTHVGAVLILGVHIVGSFVWARVAGPVGAEQRAEAWRRAYEIDREDAQLAAVVVAAVPVAVLAALVLMVWPHLMEGHGRAEEYGVWVPLLAVLWVTATLRWIEACQEHLARALRAADQRFRAYWNAPGV